MQEFPPTSSTNRYVVRWESYVGFVIRHPRGAARLKGVTNT
jgi:hypothetical protein